MTFIVEDHSYTDYKQVTLLLMISICYLQTEIIFSLKFNFNTFLHRIQCKINIDDFLCITKTHGYCVAFEGR